MADDQKPEPKDDALLDDAEGVQKDSETQDDHVAEPFDDQKTDEAVEDIVKNESDELLEAQDESADVPVLEKPHTGLWHKRWFRWCLFLLVVAGIGGTFGYPTSRYAILNLAGVRVSSSVNVVDNTTGQPLKNATVTIGDTTISTDGEGDAKLSNLHLGPQKLSIKRTAFAPQTKTVTLGWGSNPLGSFKLKAVGVQYVLMVQDYANQKPLAGVEATSGQASAISDKNGKIVLTVEGTDAGIVPVSLTLGGYRTEELSVNSDAPAPPVAAMVLATKEVFVSKAGGKYDMYKIDLDGKNKQLLLAGTGAETNNMSLAVSPDGDEVAFVSTRDNKRAVNGTLLQTLSLVRMTDGSKVTLASAEQIQLIDWIGSRLIFRLSGVNDTADAPLNSVVSYDYKGNSRAQLAGANNLSIVMSAGGRIFYAVGPSDGDPELALYRINPDGGAKQKILDKDIWAGQRTGYNTLAFQTADGWQSYDIAGSSIAESAAPSSYVSRVYTDKPGKPQSLWIDTRAGKETLVLYDATTGKETAVYAQSGLANPVRWVNDTTAIVRLVTGQEVADYVVGVTGGIAHKITDLSNTFGFSQGL